MPSVVVNEEKGTFLSYADSGVPGNSTDYTTVFLIQGYLWHAGLFRPMFPYAELHNLRLIAVNTREYDGSSPFTDSELSLLMGDEEDQEIMLFAQAEEIARFIAHFITHENIPPLTEANGIRTGGVAISSWSTASGLPLALLANLGKLDSSLSATLERHMRTIILDDPPSVMYGIPEPSGAYHPLKDVTLAPDQAHTAFLDFVCSYYEDYPNLESVTADSVRNRRTMPELCSDTKWAATTHSPEELEKYTDPVAGARLGPGFVDWGVYAENVWRALLSTQGHWKNVNLVAFWGSKSMWPTPWGASQMVERLKASPRDGEVRREVRFVRKNNANHFFHYEHPDVAVQLIRENLR